MPYQDSSLANRLAQYPEGHRGYATPGVRYGKKGLVQLPHRPPTVSGRDIDKRLGLVNGQQKGDKAPFRDNLVPGGLSKKYNPMRNDKEREAMQAREQEMIAEQEMGHKVGRSLMEFSLRSDALMRQRLATMARRQIAATRKSADKISRAMMPKKPRRVLNANQSDKYPKYTTPAQKKNQKLIEKAKEMRANGASQMQIAQATGRTQSWVSKHLRA